MSELHRFFHLAWTSPRADKIILLITFALTVFADLVIAVNVGVVLASLLFMRRMAQSVQVVEDSSDGTVGEGLDLPPHTLVYRIDGPFFFGAAEKLEHTLDNIQSHMKQIVLRLDRVPFVDATGMQSLAEMADDFRRHGTQLVLCEVRPNVLEKLQRAGVLKKVGEENVFPTLRDFVQHAQAISANQPTGFLPR